MPPSHRGAATARFIDGLIGAALAAAVLAVGVTPVFAQTPTPSKVEAGRAKATPCAACHGPDGNATIPGTPSLAGQPTMFTHWQLLKYRDGRRKDAQMAPFAANLSDEDMADLAAFYAAQTPARRPATLDARKVADGNKAAVFYQCTSCHRQNFAGHEQIPRLAGQDLAYLRKMIRGFKEKTASDLDGTMTMAAVPLTEEDIEILAQYAASLGGP
jgi:cytochrome c553